MPCCARCGRRVFCTEGVVAFNRVWHTFCFACYNCDKLLDPASVELLDGEIFCKCCKLFLDCGRRCQPVCPPTPMPKCTSCCKPNVCCLKPVCPRKTTRNFLLYSCKCCPQDCSQPCKRLCSPCTVVEPCPPKSCCDSACDPDPCCNSPRRCVMYPPIKCCEPYPSEIICVAPSADDPPRRCCPTSYSCNCAKSNYCCESFCQRCGQKVSLVTSLGTAQIFLLGCYRRMFGVEGYGMDKY
ncbi:hypothetical protein RI129_013176 [Pyrocoelia pectoralis]|uniref:LIM zinc-binding domain-containing protein n=1 Tax=Pyrocoelia pectoralis TaxID=417401 RepID=A0AAN7V5H2_9COLE